MNRLMQCCVIMLAAGCQCRAEVNFSTESSPVGVAAGSTPVPAVSAAPEPSGAPESSVAPEPSEPDPKAQQPITLKGKQGASIPLHPAEGEQVVSARVADGASARLIERGKRAGWFLVETQDGQRGWVSRRYIEQPKKQATGEQSNPADDALPVGSPWRSLADCQQSLAAGKRRARADGVASIGTWNIRWFPDGIPGHAKSEAEGTNIPWLACAIAWLNVDVLAAQELKTDAETKSRWTELIQLLDKSTNGDWTYLTDTCPGEGRQHVGFFYDRHKARVRGSEQLAELNPSGQACGGHLRPGLGAYFQFSGGLDLHLVTVHLKSGASADDYQKRQTSLAALGAIAPRLQATARDEDEIVLGDFNTMGCENCTPAVSAEAERDQLSRMVAALPEPLAERGGALCSHYYRERPGLLDHFIVAPKMRELPFSAVPKAYGLCEIFSCSPIPGAIPSAERELSDHCPLVLDLSDRDLDSP